MRKFKVLMLFLCFVVFAASAIAQVNKPIGMPDQSKAFGKTYGEWSAAWWKWALQMPATEHPIFDTADCSLGQTGEVWFLGGKLCATTSTEGGCVDPMHIVAERSCKIPHGKALFFPVMNGEDSYVEEAPGTTEMNLRTNVKSWNEPTEGFMAMATVDDWPMHIVRICSFGTYCTPQQSAAFTFTLAGHDNVLAAIGEGWVEDGTTSGSVSDGYYVLVPPLPAGEHTIKFFGANWGSFSVEMTYHLTITK